jgi:copper chaperone CopZ
MKDDRFHQVEIGEIGSMKIKVESEKIIKAVKKLNGIEVVLENAEDAKEAINLVLRKADLVKKEHPSSLKEVLVTSFQEYKTSAVNYKMVFLLEFVFDQNTNMEERVSLIKDVQDFFQKA